MASLNNHKGLDVLSGTMQPGGQAISENFERLADWHPRSVWDKTTAPTEDDDGTSASSSDTNFEVGSLWLDAVAHKLYICTDNTIGAAKWQLVPYHLLDDSTVNAPKLAADLDVNGKKLVSSSNADIVLEPNGTGKVAVVGDVEFADSAITTGDSQSLTWTTPYAGHSNGKYAEIRNVADDNGGTCHLEFYVSRFVSPGVYEPIQKLSLGTDSDKGTSVIYGSVGVTGAIYSGRASTGWATNTPLEGAGSGGYSYLEVAAPESGLNSSGVMFGNSSVNGSRAWIGTTYDFNYGSILQFFSPRTGNHSYNTYDALLAMQAYEPADNAGHPALSLLPSGGEFGVFGVTPVPRQAATADLKDLLVNYGLAQGTSASPLNLDGGTLAAGDVQTKSATVQADSGTTTVLSLVHDTGLSGLTRIVFDPNHHAYLTDPANMPQIRHFYDIGDVTHFEFAPFNGFANPKTSFLVRAGLAEVWASNAPGTAGTVTALKLVRPQSDGISYPEVAAFQIGKYAASGTAPSTQLDIQLKSTSANDHETDVTVMTLLDTGKVGIGTDTPSYSLDVAGAINGLEGIVSGVGSGGTHKAWSINQDAITIFSNALGEDSVNGISLSYQPYGDSPYGYGAKMIIGWGLDAATNPASFDLGDWVNIGRTGHDIVFTTNGGSVFSERLRITQAGNLGVGTTSPTALLDLNGDTLRLRSSRTPATSSASGNAGEFCWDSNYVYVCTASNTWKRTALSTW